MYPILFEFGFVTVFSLWFFIVLGFAAAAVTFVRLAKHYRIRLNVITANSFLLILSTILAARIIFIILHPDLYFYRFEFTNLFAIWDKGLSFWGALAAWTYGVWHFSKKNRQSPAKLLDIMAPALVFGIALGSIGAFLDGINYGTTTDLPWGVTFRSAHVKYISAIHPTQIYLTVYSACIGVCLIILLKKIRGRLDGFVAEAGVFLFGFFKFIEEFFRGDETIEIFSLRVPQILAFAAMILAGWLICRRYANKKNGDPEHILQKFTERHFPKLAAKFSSKLSPK